GNGQSQTVKVVKKDQLVSVVIKYIDESTKSKVGSIGINNVVDGQTLSIPEPTEDGYVLSDANASVVAKDGAEYSINVTKEVSNNVIFKTADNEQVGTATISGKKVGDAVDVTSQLPNGYTTKDANVTLQG